MKLRLLVLFCCVLVFFGGCSLRGERTAESSGKNAALQEKIQKDSKFNDLICSIDLDFTIKMILRNKFEIYQGPGYVQAVVVTPEDYRYVSTAKKFSVPPGSMCYPQVNLCFPDDFKGENSPEIRTPEGIYRYYYLIDGKRVISDMSYPFMLNLAENSGVNPSYKKVHYFDLWDLKDREDKVEESQDESIIIPYRPLTGSKYDIMLISTNFFYSVRLNLENRFESYRGFGNVQAVVITPEKAMHVTDVKKFSVPSGSKTGVHNHPSVCFRYPDDFKSDDGWGIRASEGIYRYYFLVDGEKVLDEKNSSFMLNISRSSSITPSYCKVDLFDLRNLESEEIFDK